MTSHRLIEGLVGTGVLGYSAYAVCTGRVFGRNRAYSRWQQPWTFWPIVLTGLICGLLFLLGGVSWRA